MKRRSRSFQGKSVLLNGSDSLATELALRFCQQGARLVIAAAPSAQAGGGLDSVIELAARLRKEGCQAVPYLGDVSEEHHAKGAIETVRDQFGRLDVLVHLPEGWESPDFDELSGRILKPAHALTSLALPLLRKSQGCLLIASSEAGVRGMPGRLLEGAASGWIHSYVRAIAAQESSNQVRINTVCSARAESVEELIEAYLFLASNEARAISGAIWVVPSREKTEVGAGREAA